MAITHCSHRANNKVGTQCHTSQKRALQTVKEHTQLQGHNMAAGADSKHLIEVPGAVVTYRLLLMLLLWLGSVSWLWHCCRMLICNKLVELTYWSWGQWCCFFSAVVGHVFCVM